MDEPLLIHDVQSKRDVLRARQRARQIASLLGYGAREQAEIAAACFVLALDALHKARQTKLRFVVGDDSLLVTVEDCISSCAALRLQRPLPSGPRKFAAEDCRFIAEQLGQFMPRDLFTEIEKQNLELIQALVELRSLEAAQREMPRQDISAA